MLAALVALKNSSEKKSAVYCTADCLLGFRGLPLESERCEDARGRIANYPQPVCKIYYTDGKDFTITSGLSVLPLDLQPCQSSGSAPLCYTAAYSEYQTFPVVDTLFHPRRTYLDE